MVKETMNIPVHSRSQILKHRNNWDRSYKVTLRFPKNERFGEYQTIHLEGLQLNVSSVKRLIHIEVDKFNDSYRDYKKRKERMTPTKTYVPKQVQVQETKAKPKATGFSILAVDSDSELEDEEEVVEVEEVEKQLGNWGDEE